VPQAYNRYTMLYEKFYNGWKKYVPSTGQDRTAIKYEVSV